MRNNNNSSFKNGACQPCNRSQVVFQGCGKSWLHLHYPWNLTTIPCSWHYLGKIASGQHGIQKLMAVSNHAMAKVSNMRPHFAEHFLGEKDR